MNSEELTPPKHIGIIIDGNRRRAKQHGLTTFEGHYKGVLAVEDVMEAAQKRGIPTLSIYGFSTENRKREGEEIEGLMKIFSEILEKLLYKVIQGKNIKINILGDKERFSESLQALMQKVESASDQNTQYTLNLCLSYGGRNEIVQACKNILKDTQSGKIVEEEISEDLFNSYLYTQGQSYPDLIIRTSGEQRLSNFLTWQSAYSELIFLDTLWPDFNEEVLDQCLEEFSRRKRRFGK
ncbi:MAG: polyprenyl diphosphate synthase [Candidatus Absconditabacteria bacterium]|nr:polyprenyl diphosphate synthase [Candidatus Absconditabacteria bacterium]MDD3868665.1 polyprenyl diphosphate synthase [Candidatus Absconditabacteria bacterium]MDD4714484.1 polyprenyl diphosphate synthase [Candidatus Absconditabacteria bacterium]